MLPLRRKDLLIEDLGDEIVVYDPVRHRAHCLNRPARLVLDHCDGKTSVGGLVALLRKQLKSSLDTEAVRDTLARLNQAHLLEPESLPSARAVSRRGLGKKLAAAGIGAVVFSMAVPTAALAAATFRCCTGGNCPGGQAGSCCNINSNYCQACFGGACPSGQCCKPASVAGGCNSNNCA